MANIGIWHIQPHGPVKLKESEVDLEQQLEDWIEQDPTLVQSGLVIVARQMTFEGGRLDLLALDPQGRWVIIEIKAGAVRNETIGQAFYYASVINRMPFATLEGKVNEYLQSKDQKLDALLKKLSLEKATVDENRDFQILLVGTSQAYGLDKVVNFLTDKYEFPLSTIAFDVYQTTSGERVLVRELAETDVSRPDTKPPRILKSATMPELEEIATSQGTVEIFVKLVNAARKYGMHMRMYAGSVMIAPPQNKTRMLFTIWAKGKQKGKLKYYLGPEAFAQYYSVNEDEVVRLLGPSGYHEMDMEAAEKFLDGLEQLFAGIREETLTP